MTIISKISYQLIAGLFIGFWLGTYYVSAENISIIATWAGLIFTVVGTLVGLAAVYKSHEATIKKMESDSCIASIKLNIELIEFRMSIMDRLRVLQSRLGNNIENMSEEITTNKIDKMINPLSNELYRLEPLIRIYFSDTTVNKFIECRGYAVKCSNLRASEKFIESNEYHNKMDDSFKELLNDYIPSDMKVNTQKY